VGASDRIVENESVVNTASIPDGEASAQIDV